MTRLLLMYPKAPVLLRRECYSACLAVVGSGSYTLYLKRTGWLSDLHSVQSSPVCHLQGNTLKKYIVLLASTTFVDVAFLLTLHRVVRVRKRVHAAQDRYASASCSESMYIDMVAFLPACVSGLNVRAEDEDEDEEEIAASHCEPATGPEAEVAVQPLGHVYWTSGPSMPVEGDPTELFRFSLRAREVAAIIGVRHLFTEFHLLEEEMRRGQKSASPPLARGSPGTLRPAAFSPL